MTSRYQCSGVRAALEAAKEAPRCIFCDRFLPDWIKGDALACKEGEGCKEEP